MGAATNNASVQWRHLDQAGECAHVQTIGDYNPTTSGSSCSHPNLEIPLTHLARVPHWFYRIRWHLIALLRAPLFGRLLPVPVGCVVVLAPLCLLSWMCVHMFLDPRDDFRRFQMSGHMAALLLPVIFVFGTRNSIVTFLSGLTFERALIIHKLFAVGGVVLGFVHGGYVFWALVLTPGGSLQYLIHGPPLTGLALQSAMFVLVATSLFRWFRKKFFELWLRLHFVLIAVVVVFTALHTGAIFLVGAGLWLLDLLVRFGTTWRNKRNAAKVMVRRLSDDLVEVSFARGRFAYGAGQYVFLCVPKLSLFEWHPFSLSSAPHQQQVTMHIRASGDWTRSLHKLSTDEGVLLEAFFEGPYGSLSVNTHAHDTFLLVCGGVGVTPILSVARDLKHTRPNVSLRIVWAARNPLDFSTLTMPDELAACCSRFCTTQTTQQHYQADCDTVSVPIMARGGVAQGVVCGRPDISAELDRALSSGLPSQSSSVCVLTCGPISLMNSVEEQVHRRRALCCCSSSPSIAFHRETFQL